MSRKVALWSLWAGFLVYVLLLAPPIQQNTFILLKNLLTGQWTEINPIILSIFSLVGIWILIYTSVMLFDGRMQKIPAWPFLIASAATGVISLIPYLALREPNGDFSGKKDTVLKVFDSRWTGVILTFSTIVLIGYGWLLGDWRDFVVQCQSDRFVNGMTVAFCLFCVLFPTVLGDDLARRGIKNYQIFWLFSLIPLFGPLLYLCWRPPIWESIPPVSSPSIEKSAVTSSRT